MAVGTISIANELLVQALHLPEDTKIISSVLGGSDREICLLVEHADIKPERNSFPNLNPTLARENGKVIFKGWGQK